MLLNHCSIFLSSSCSPHYPTLSQFRWPSYYAHRRHVLMMVSSILSCFQWLYHRCRNPCHIVVDYLVAQATFFLSVSLNQLASIIDHGMAKNVTANLISSCPFCFKLSLTHRIWAGTRITPWRSRFF